MEDDYLKVLKYLVSSKITARYHFHRDTLISEEKLLLKGMGIKEELWPHHSRAGNIKVKYRFNLPRRQGALRCQFHLRSNYLLPNGNVLLCFNYNAMKHTLGNLVFSSCDYLLEEEKFEKILRGQRNES